MPIRFRCPNCDRKLKARDDHADRQLPCPNCNQLLTVPADSALSRIMAESQTADSGEDDPFSELIVYDDEIIYDTDEAGTDREERPKRSSKIGWVGVSRRLIYAHALLLPVLALAGLVFGYMIGRTNRLPVQIQVAPPEHRVLITGQLQWEGQTKQISDRGAVVIAIPQDFKPTQKLPGDKVGPSQPVPSRDSQLVSSLEDWGGDYARTNETGEFELFLLPGAYQLLFVSGQSKRPTAAPPDRDDLAAIGQFFTLPHEIIGPQRYHWTSEELDEKSRLLHEFAR